MLLHVTTQLSSFILQVTETDYEYFLKEKNPQSVTVIRGTLLTPSYVNPPGAQQTVTSYSDIKPITDVDVETLKRTHPEFFL